MRNSLKSEILKYCKGALADKFPSGKLLKLACQRFLDDLNRKDLVMDWAAAEHFIKFYEGTAYHWKGRLGGQPIVLEDFQKFKFANIYGWYYKEKKYRRFRKNIVQIARKNAKTTDTAMQAIYHITADGEEGAQSYCIATKQDQARLLTTDVGSLIEKSEVLNGKYDLRRHRNYFNDIMYGSSFIKALGRDSDTLDGLHGSQVNGDEWHAWTYGSSDYLLNVVEDSMQGRNNPQTNLISTAGFDMFGYGYQEIRDQAVKILEGVIENDRVFSLIYELDEGDDWKDPSVWQKASPAIGRFLDIEQDIMPRFLEAENRGGMEITNFQTKYLNRWLSAPDVWVQPEIIKENNHYPVKIDDFVGRRCWGGLDLGGTGDLSAFALIAEGKNNILDCYLHFWMPESKLKSRDKVDYGKWVEEGYITLTEGNVIDHEPIYSKIAGWYNEGIDIECIYYDRNMSETHGTVQGLITHGVSNLTPLNQGVATMTVYIQELERRLLSGRMNFKNPVLEWMFNNCQIIPTSSGPFIDRQKRTKKVDGVHALLDALACYMEEGSKDINQEVFFI